ncbi:hypothetical protein EV175_006404, partial [Coemansia sp. RSA 1933]
MSDYKPIDDDSEPQTRLKTEHAPSSYSSHPYKAGYGGSAAARGGGKQPGADSQTIDIGRGSSQDGYDRYGGEPTAGPSTFNSQDGGQRISRYETSLPIRHDVEAAIAYLLCIYS